MTIESQRLLLVPMTVPFLESCLKDDLETASAIIGFAIPAGWEVDEIVFQMRLDQLQADPAFQPWSLRAIALHESQELIGHIGFHTPPGPCYLRDYAPGGVELGYTISAAFRRQGFARESCHRLMKWAHDEQGVELFVVSISPQNEPSLRMAQQLEFVKVGSHIDETDGEEHIFMLRYPGSTEK